MAIKKFVINDKIITYQCIEKNQNLEITTTNELKHERKLILENRHFDQVTGILFFSIEGKPYKVSVTSLQNSEGLQSWHVSFAHKKYPITVDCHQAAVPIIPAVHTNSLQFSAKSVGKTSLKSPLAGRVSKVLVQPAQRVEKGQPLFLIESMKMENEICATHDAFIKTLFILEGNVVQQNQILIDFECEGEADATAKNADEQKTVQNRGSSPGA